jgi:hypothetical protein
VQETKKLPLTLLHGKKKFVKQIGKQRQSCHTEGGKGFGNTEAFRNLSKIQYSETVADSK